MIWPFGWPRPLWIFLMGREPEEADLVFGILFLAGCNIALYGLLAYATLTIFSLLRSKPVDYDSLPPPPPKSFQPRPE